MITGLSRADEDFTSLGSGLAVLGFPDFLPSLWSSLLERHPFPGTSPRNVNLLLGYSGREEIVRAAEEVIKSGRGRGLGESDIDRHLLTRGQADPDLIIFSSRDLTPGDFMIWQASYAEIWHSPLLVEDFTPGEIDRAMKGYERRERRFGKV
jgi:undecaprenyl diphosphate synthase